MPQVLGNFGHTQQFKILNLFFGQTVFAMPFFIDPKCDNVYWTMLNGYVKLINICWATNQVYIVINFSQFSFERIAQLVAHLLHKQEVPGLSIVHGTRVFFFLVNDYILLTSDFGMSFHSFS